MIAAFSAFWTGSAYKTTILESEAASAKTTTAVLTLLIYYQEEMNSECTDLAVTDKRDGLKRQGKLYKTIKATYLPEERI